MNSRPTDDGSMDVLQGNLCLQSLTIYDSQMSDNSPRHPESRQKIVASTQGKQFQNSSDICSRPSPMNLPIESPLPSPYASPLNFEKNSQAPSPRNLHPSLGCSSGNTCSESPSPVMEKIQPKEITDQWDSCQNYQIEKLQAVPAKELETLDIFKDTGAKLTKDPDCERDTNKVEELVMLLKELKDLNCKPDLFLKKMCVVDQVLETVFLMEVTDTKITDKQRSVIGPLIHDIISCLGSWLCCSIDEIDEAHIEEFKIKRSGLEYIFQKYKDLPDGEAQPLHVSFEILKEIEDLEGWDEHFKNVNDSYDSNVFYITTSDHFVDLVPESHWWWH